MALSDLSCLSMPLKCLLVMMLIFSIMATPVLLLLGPPGWIVEGVAVIASVVGLLATTGGNILKIFEK